MKKPTTSRTVTDFLDELQQSNQTVAAWARGKGLQLADVYAFVSGRTTGKRGKSRDIALAMGLTPPAMFGPTGHVIHTAVRSRKPRAAANAA